MSQLDQLHPVDFAAVRLGVGRTTVYELIRADELRSVKIRGRRLVPESAIAEYIASLAGVGRECA